MVKCILKLRTQIEPKHHKYTANKIDYVLKHEWKHS